MKRVFFLGLILFAFCGAGCSDSANPDTATALRLDLLPTAPEPRSRSLAVREVLNWPADSTQISVSGARADFEPGAGAAGGAQLELSMLAGETEFPALVSVTLRGQFDPASFNKLVLAVDSAHDAYVHCTLRSKGIPMWGSSNRARIEARDANSGPRRVVLDLPSARRFHDVPDELELIFDNVATAFGLGPIELCHQPIWAWLPAAEEGFDMVALGSDAREAVGLSTARSLEAEVLVPPNAELHCFATIPTALRFGGKQASLKVEIHGEGGRSLLQRVALDTSTSAVQVWHPLRVRLGKFAGQKVRVTFSFSIENKLREAVCALTRPRIDVAKSAPRTVLLVTSDTHRADSLGAMDNGLGIATPALDALARRGVLFLDCWSSTNVTIPSHAAIMTATSPRDSGVLDNYTRLSRKAYTLAEAFRAAGFATYAVVSAPHLSDAASGLGQGFDRLNAPVIVHKRPAAQSIAQLRAWLDDAEGQDLFLWLHLYDAHTPYEPPPEFEARYWPAGRDAFDPKLPEPLVPKVFRVNLPAGLRDLELLSARYHGEVSYLDAELAQLFEVARIRSGLIAFTADHGESLGEHGIFWEHAGLYPQSVHVPLILAWPDAPAGTRVQQPVFQLDLARTILKLSGVEDARMPGGDLLAPQSVSRSPRFTISSAADRASVTVDGWHMIVSLRGYLVTVGAEQKAFPRHHIELFNLGRDPQCLHDLAREERVRAGELRRLLCAWLASATPRGWGDAENLNTEMAEHLAQLGYAARTNPARVVAIDPDCACGECRLFLAQR